jgi:hypothetical protein
MEGLIDRKRVDSEKELILWESGVADISGARDDSPTSRGGGGGTKLTGILNPPPLSSWPLPLPDGRGEALTGCTLLDDDDGGMISAVEERESTTALVDDFGGGDCGGGGDGVG